MSAGWIAFCIIMSYILLLCFIVYVGINLKTNKVMKELSIEEKAKRYDEAYKVAKNIHIFSSYLAEIKRMEEIFPELKEESEGERIRKRICKLLWDNAPYEEAQEYIAWLEKQGNPTEDELEALRMAAYEPTKNWSEKLQSLYEKLTHCEQKPVIKMKSAEESLGIDSDTYNKIVDECIYGEQKLANKIEPKDYSSIDPHFFKTTDNVEPKFKVGDSIISTISNIPYYITEVCNGHYLTDVGCIIMFNAQDNFELVEQKPAWTEEDERILVEMLKIFNIEKFEGYNIGENNENALKFLKSLKERVQPKQEWSEDDEVKINRIVACLENLNVADNDILLKDVDWLKSLKDRVGCEVNCTTKQQWKPSDEQMKQLGWIAKQNKDNMIGKELMSLYQDLKNKV